MSHEQNNSKIDLPSSCTCVIFKQKKWDRFQDHITSPKNYQQFEGSCHRTAAGANSPVLERHQQRQTFGPVVCHAGWCFICFYAKPIMAYPTLKKPRWIEFGDSQQGEALVTNCKHLALP